MNWFLNSGEAGVRERTADRGHLPGQRQQHRLHRLGARSRRRRAVDSAARLQRLHRPGARCGPSGAKDARSNPHGSGRSPRVWAASRRSRDRARRHDANTRRRPSRRPVRSHRRGDGQQRDVDERLAEAEAARAVLGAIWRVNLRWPDRAIGRTPTTAHAAALVRHVRPVRWRPVRSDRHPDHVAASQMLTEAVFNSGLRRYDAGADERGGPSGSATTSSTIRRPHLRRRRVGALRTNAARWRATPVSSAPQGTRRCRRV